MPIAEFCRATGLPEATVATLLRSNLVEGLFDAAGRAVGLFDDVLPTAEALRALGVDVRADYDPEAHRSYEHSEKPGADDPDDPDDDDSAWS